MCYSYGCRITTSPAQKRTQQRWAREATRLAPEICAEFLVSSGKTSSVQTKPSKVVSRG